MKEAADLPAAPLGHPTPPLPALLTQREREPYLAAIEFGKPRLGDWNYPDMLKRLLAKYDALATRAEQAEAAARDLLGEFYAGNEPLQYDVNNSKRRTAEMDGENRERGKMRSWVILRAQQMGIPFEEIRQRPAKGFQDPKSATAAPVAGEARKE